MKITFYVAFGLAGLALGGCSYKPLDAPCSFAEGGGPAQSSKLEIAPTVARRSSRNSNPGAFLRGARIDAGVRAVSKR